MEEEKWHVDCERRFEGSSLELLTTPTNNTRTGCDWLDGLDSSMAAEKRAADRGGHPISTPLCDTTPAFSFELGYTEWVGPVQPEARGQDESTKKLVPPEVLHVKTPNLAPVTLTLQAGTPPSAWSLRHRNAPCIPD
jgi:hypothetical protein